MCELFGASLKKEKELKGLLEPFFSHSVKHPNGWGILCSQNGKREILRESVRAVDSKKLPKVLEDLGKQNNLLAHIRLATVGSTRVENCHPFSGVDASGRQWNLIHNGTIYSSRTLAKYIDLQTGDTDSERVFLNLLERLQEAYEKYGELNAQKRFQVVEDLVVDHSERNKLNLMIYDGEFLYVHKNMRNTLSMKQDENGIIFSTTPLEEDWQEVPMCQLLAVREGELWKRGEKTTSEFIPTTEYMSAMAAMNI